jgi:CheY-like chemotaxis protein
MDGTVKRVLVVDDDEGFRDTLILILQDMGYDVRAAMDGDDALTLLKFWSPHLIVLDVMMPLLDGWEFCERYGARVSRPIPIIVVSAAVPPSEAEGKPGVVAFLEKPFDLDALLDLIKQHTQQR